MKTTKKIRNYSLMAILFAGMITGCSKDEEEAVTPIAAPAEEEELEVITDVKLIFTNTADANDVVEARAKDPDGAGVQELAVLDEVTLDTNKSYTLTFEIFNNLETPGEDIGVEINEEDDEHQIFFSFSDNAFSNPMGNGNIDSYTDPLNYADTDKDENGNPVGLTTSWTTSSTTLSGGTFTVRLQHQPDVKTATSGANDGDTDFELPFVLNIQ